MNDTVKEPVEQLDLLGMVDENLDNIETAPEFLSPPAGAYRIGVVKAAIESYKSKKTPDVESQRIRIVYKVLETIACANPNEPPVPNESLFSETFMGTQDGLSYFKRTAKNIMGAVDTDGVPLRELMSSLVAAEFHARISIKTSPKPGSTTGEVYENIQIRVVPAPVA